MTLFSCQTGDIPLKHLLSSFGPERSGSPRFHKLFVVDVTGKIARMGNISESNRLSV